MEMQEYNFIGRERELKRLDKMYSSRGQEVALIYGRRRVGKSELIKYFIQQHDEDAIYYECTATLRPRLAASRRTNSIRFT